ncbi:MAG: hypothetical protein P1U47_01830 [Zhongshania sp.]|uniref:alpha/beta fold hydrolase n=1 Tax=Zhongshania sp. TaxID=1971902 RepID=UPI002617C9E2|nr:hypothetical protein [Zhongshania sp.]MDF1691085.1 hypothetical protein [Zhongshania sp.]
MTFLNGVFLSLRICLLIFMFSACSSPTQRIDATAQKYGMEKQVLMGLGFKHVVYSRPPSKAEVLHIYLDGDGSPWLRGRYIASDPTPTQSLGLSLASLDTQADAVYLGRPCYLGLVNEPGCNESMWTSARYSEALVRSMAKAADSLIAARGAKQVRLIGYSGGGSLAMLMLRYMEKVDAVITIAANLDTRAWTSYHNYLALTDSLNPMDNLFPTGIRYWHFAGSDDDNVPPQHLSAFVAKHGGESQVIRGFDHYCCWSERWPSLLSTALGHGSGG